MGRGFERKWRQKRCLIHHVYLVITPSFLNGKRKVLKVDSIEILPTLRMLINLHVSKPSVQLLIELVSVI